MKRIVVKVGTSTICHEGGGVNFRLLDKLAMTLSDIHNGGTEVILVTSGAIGVGTGKLRLPARPSELRGKQAAAAVGQCELMHIYDKFFGEYGVTVGQILLSREDVERPTVRQNLISTFEALLELGVIPIVNENDSVCIEQIESEHKVFGDNDTLSATVAELVGAELLILLSDIDGLYTADPRRDESATLIRRADPFDGALDAIAGGAGSALGTGGMQTKLTSARIAARAGIDTVITNGARPEEMFAVTRGESVGTRFYAVREEKLK